MATARIEERIVAISAETRWLQGSRHFPGEFRLPDVACVLSVKARTDLKDCGISDTGYYISSRRLNPQRRRNRRGRGAVYMAIICHVAFNPVRPLDDNRSLKNR